MATDKFKKLAAKLRELFQLDQPDLDFGIYRVMHLKRDAVERYLDPKAPDGLRAVIEAEFASTSAQSANDALEKARAKVVEAFGPDAIGADGSLSAVFANTPVGRAYAEAQAAAASAQGSAEGKKDVFDLLLDFFSRYYQGGDFVSKRHISRESDSRSLSYAIPYGGEEVKLHWANADQYYIKTSENFSSYTFDLSQAREIKSMDAMARMANGIPNRPMRVHFKIVEAEEGEHGNIKAGEDRYFFVDEDTPFEIPDSPQAELTVFFHHAADPNKPDKAKNWQKQLLAKSRDLILGNLDSFTSGLDSDYAAHPVHAYYAMLMTACPTDGDPDRVLLDRYLEQYAARNTEDYFIHKDLGGFLRRELEFYVKNEILNISDLARQPDEALMAVSEAQLRRARAFYRVARRIMDDFLAPLEDFQKKLWLKRKFVVQCDWCLTLDIVREHAPELLDEIFANEEQKKNWAELGFPEPDLAVEDSGRVVDASLPGLSDGRDGSTSRPPLDARMVDTKFFDETFKAKLLAAIPDLDERTDGVLVHSENFQALRLMQERYKEQVKCIYIDPPYNTGSDGFLYKDGYSHSSWLSLMQDRIVLSKALLAETASIFVNVNDIEDYRLRSIMNQCFGCDNYVTTVITKCSTASSFRTVNPGPVDISDRIIYFARNKEKMAFSPQPVEKQPDLSHFSRYVVNLSESPEKWQFEPIKLRVLRDMGFSGETTRECMKNAIQSLGVSAESIVDAQCRAFAVEHADAVFETKTFQKPSPWLREWIEKSIAQPSVVIQVERDGLEPVIMMGGRQFYFLSKSVRIVNGKRCVTEPASTIWTDIDTNNLRHEGSVEFANGKKPLKLLVRILSMAEQSQGEVVLDFFAGSGTMGHATIDLNRQDGGKRKYILVEMGEHFDTALKPRIEKVVYSPDWRDDKPLCADKGISHCFKYLTLESYEDTLNNLSFDKEPKGADGVSDYLLRYMLETGTKGSPSLLDAAAFAHPFSCKLDVKKPGSEERETRTVDLVETFNWLLGLRVRRMSGRKRYSADFERMPDPDLPAEAEATRLRVKDRLRLDGEGPFAFQTVEGTVPRDRDKPDGAVDKVIVVWRELTGDAERDNAALDAFLQREKVNALDGECDLIYVNGSNNVPCLRREDQTWKVRLIEGAFLERMWEEEA